MFCYHNFWKVNDKVLFVECKYKTNFFYWKDKETQISVRIRCMFAKHSGRFSIGQTGKTSPRSICMVQPQQIHVLKDKLDSEKLRKSIKYGVRNFRLKLIQRWAKKTMRHYAQTQRHKNKRQKLVNL